MPNDKPQEPLTPDEKPDVEKPVRPPLEPVRPPTRPVRPHTPSGIG